MTTGKQYEDDGDRLMHEGKLDLALVQLNLASKEYGKERNSKKASECAILYKYLSGTAHMGNATNPAEIEQAISELKEARKLLKHSRDKESKDVLMLTEGTILQARAIKEVWEGKVSEGLKLMEEAGKQFLLAKDKVPDLADLMEGSRLEAISEAYFGRALESLQAGDLPSYMMNLGASRKNLQDLIDLVKDDDMEAFYSGWASLKEAIAQFMMASRELGSDEMQKAMSTLRESSKSALKASQTFPKSTKLPIERKLQTSRQLANGHQAAVKAVTSFVEAQRSLYLGQSELAKRAFLRAAKECELSIQQLATTGQLGGRLVASLFIIQGIARREASTISTVVRFSRSRLALSAGAQFGLVFFVTLGSFISIGSVGLLVVSSDLAVYTSLIVAAITAFGLNAVKLKDLLLPARTSQPSPKT